MGKRIICGCVVLGIVACLIGCQKSDNYELMKESKQQVLPIYEKKDAEVQGEKCALETLQDVYKSDYILEDDKNAGKNVRNDATYNKDYLTGRYGAIPVLEEFDIIHEK